MKKTFDDLLNEVLKKRPYEKAVHLKRRPYEKPVNKVEPAKEKNLKAFNYPLYAAGLNVKADVYAEIMENFAKSELEPTEKKHYLSLIMKIFKAKSGKILRAEDTDGYASAMEMHLDTGYVFIDNDHPNMMTSFDSEEYWTSTEDGVRHYEGEKKSKKSRDDDDEESFEDERIFEKTNFKSGVSTAVDWMTDCEWREPQGRE